VPDLPLDHVARPAHLRIGRRLEPQHLQRRHDRRERVAQLVCEGGEEFILAAQ